MEDCPLIRKLAVSVAPPMAARGPHLAFLWTAPNRFAPSDRCITFGVPRVNGVYSAGLHGYYQIVQTPKELLLFSENIHESRIIYLDGGPHLPANVRSWAGDSRGKWDGNTLVVDTTNFRPQLHLLGVSENFHMTERFTRVAQNEVRYEVMFDDPETWVKPWTVMILLKQTEDHLSLLSGR